MKKIEIGGTQYIVPLVREDESLEPLMKYRFKMSKIEEGIFNVTFLSGYRILEEITIYTPETYDDYSMLRDHCVALIEEQDEYWYSLKDTTRISHPDSIWCAWLDKRSIPSVMHHLWAEIGYRINAGLYCEETYKLSFWKKLNDRLKVLKSYEKRAIHMNENGIVDPRMSSRGPINTFMEEILREINFDNFLY